MGAAGYRTATHLAQDSGLRASTLSEALSGSKTPSEQTLKRFLGSCNIPYTGEWARRLESAKAAEYAAKRESRRRTGGGDSSLSFEQHAHSTHPLLIRQDNKPTPITQMLSLEPPLGFLPPHVRGRSEVLKSLQSHLEIRPNKFIVLHGMGGCGKTTLALSVARDARYRNFDVFWVKASREHLDGSMRQLCRRLGATPEEIEEAWERTGDGPDFLWRLLDSSDKPWLLVFDEVDEPQSIGRAHSHPGDATGWLRSSKNGLTVVTTRLGDPEIWGHSAELHSIDPLTPNEGAEVLLDLANRAGSRQEAQDLSARLGGLPLALRLAGSQLSRAMRGTGLLRRGRERARVRDFSSYGAALNDVGIEYLDRSVTGALNRSGAEDLHRRLISRTWEISLDLLESQGFPEARTFMRLLSRFGPHPIPVDVLDPDALGRHDSFPSDFGVDRLELVIEALQTLSLLEIVEVIAERLDTQPAITVHSLVLEVNRGHLASEDAETRSNLTRTAVSLLEVATRRTPEDRENHLWWGLLHPHIMTLIRSTETPHKDIAEPLLEVGLRNFSYMHLAMREPMKEAANALRALSVHLDPLHPLYLAAKHRYSFTHIKEKSRLWVFSELFKECTLALGANHPETLMSHHNWVEELNGSGKFKQAESECRKVLAGRQQTLGKDNPFTLSTHMLLIKCIEDQKNGKARSGAEWVRLFESVKTSPSPGKVDFQTLHLLGHWLDKNEQYEEAERCYRTIIEALEESTTKARIFCNSMRDCLSDNLQKQGRLDDSASLYLERLRQLGETQDPASEEVMAVRHDYADLLVKMKHLSEAERMMRSVLEIRLSKEDKSSDVRLASELHCLVHALERMGRTQDVIHMARHLAEFSDAEVAAWSQERMLRDDMVCICKSLSDVGDHDAAILSLSRIIACVPPETKEAHSHRRTLALFQYASGKMSKSSFEGVLHDLAKSIEENFGKDEEHGRIQDILMGLKGDTGKSNPPA